MSTLFSYWSSVGDHYRYGSRRKRGIPPKFRHQNLSVTSFPFHIMTGTEKSSPSNHSRQHNMLCRITEKVYEKNKKSSNINNNSNTKSTPKVIKTSQIERKINLRDSKSVELHFSDIVRPAPVVRRPFENLYSPYPIGCSKLCNHPIDKDLKREYKEVIRKTKENLNEIHGSILLPDEEEILVREELRRLASTPDSDYSDILGRDHPDLDGRPDSQVMLDDDEDRIPEEQLLKYTKPDSPVPTPAREKAPTPTTSDGEKCPGVDDGGPNVPRDRRPSLTRQRSKTPDQIHAQDSEEKQKIVLDLRKTKSSENLLGPTESVDTAGEGSKSVAKESTAPPPQDPQGASISNEDSTAITGDEKAGIKTEDDDIRDEAAKIAEQEAAAAAALKNQKLQERIADHQINKREAKQSQNIVQQKEQAKAASTAPVGEKIEKDIPQPVASPQTSSGKPGKGGKGGGGDKKSKKQKKKFARHKVRSDSREVEDFYDVIEDPAETQVASKQHGGLGDVPEQTEDRGPGSAHDNQDTVFTIEDLDPDIDEFGYPLDPLDGEEGEDGGQRRRSITNGNSKDDPLDRRALLSLEKQLVLEEPESEFDLHRLKEIDDRLIREVRQASGRVGNISAIEAEIRQLARDVALPPKLNIEDNEDADFWLNLPRTFSFQSSRFELPLDMTVLEDMMPMDYLARFVSVSSSRRQLYNKVFVRFRSLKDSMLNEETTISALELVMGSTINSDLQDQLWETLGIVLKAHVAIIVNYKEFAGIAAMFERLYCQEFISKKCDQPHQSKSEIEVADFDRLFTKLETIKVEQPSMKKLLVRLKESGNIPAGTARVKGGQILSRRKSQFEFL